MKLWTVRAAAELESARWPLRADARLVDPYMRPAYRWMAGELRKKVRPPRGVKLPLWAWVARPDLRTAAHLPAGARGALLELEIPRAQVLISDFERFHAVLNRHYLPRGQADDERFERAAARASAGAWPFDRRLRAMVEKSWRRIFSQAASMRDARYWGPPALAPLQAVFWELPRDAVRSSKYFSAR